MLALRLFVGGFSKVAVAAFPVAIVLEGRNLTANEQEVLVLHSKKETYPLTMDLVLKTNETGKRGIHKRNSSNVLDRKSVV